MLCYWLVAVVTNKLITGMFKKLIQAANDYEKAHFLEDH